MNIFSRALICALLLSSSTQPIDWKYIFPWTAAVIGFGGCIGLGILSRQLVAQSMQDKNKITELSTLSGQGEKKIKELNEEIDAKNRDILRLETAAQTGSITRRKGSQKKYDPSTEETNKNKELIESLQKNLRLKDEEIQTLEERLENRDEFYDNYSPLISAMEMVSDQEYVLDVTQLNQKVLFSIIISGKTYDLIEQSKFYIPSDLAVDPTIAMWQAGKGNTIRISNKKGKTAKTRLPPPAFSETSPLPPPITSTPSGSLRDKNPHRISINPENTELAKEFLLNLPTVDLNTKT